jgi:hypothetical protein
MRKNAKIQKLLHVMKETKQNNTNSDCKQEKMCCDGQR